MYIVNIWQTCKLSEFIKRFLNCFMKSSSPPALTCGFSGTAVAGPGAATDPLGLRRNNSACFSRSLSLSLCAPISSIAGRRTAVSLVCLSVSPSSLLPPTILDLCSPLLKKARVRQ